MAAPEEPAAQETLSLEEVEALAIQAWPSTTSPVAILRRYATLELFKSNGPAGPRSMSAAGRVLGRMGHASVPPTQPRACSTCPGLDLQHQLYHDAVLGADPRASCQIIAYTLHAGFKANYARCVSAVSLLALKSIYAFVHPKQGLALVVGHLKAGGHCYSAAAHVRRPHCVSLLVCVLLAVFRQVLQSHGDGWAWVNCPSCKCRRSAWQLQKTSLVQPSWALPVCVAVHP